MEFGPPDPQADNVACLASHFGLDPQHVGEAISTLSLHKLHVERMHDDCNSATFR